LFSVVPAPVNFCDDPFKENALNKFIQTNVKRGNMKVGILILCIVGGYLVGSFSIARLVTRIMAPGRDLGVVELPDRNTNGTFQLKTVGATTASMILGPKIGGLIGILDILKGVIPTLALRLIFPDQHYFILTGAAIVVHLLVGFHPGRRAPGCRHNLNRPLGSCQRRFDHGKQMLPIPLNREFVQIYIARDLIVSVISQ